MARMELWSLKCIRLIIFIELETYTLCSCDIVILKIIYSTSFSAYYSRERRILVAEKYWEYFYIFLSFPALTLFTWKDYLCERDCRSITVCIGGECNIKHSPHSDVAFYIKQLNYSFYGYLK